MRESSEPSRRSVEIREKIGQHVRGVLTAGYIAALGIGFQPIVFQGFDDSLAASPDKKTPKRPETKAPEREKTWQPHEMTAYLQKIRSPQSQAILSSGSDKEIVNLLAEQALVRRMRDPMLSNAELGRFYPRQRPMVDPQHPKSNVEGVREGSMTFIPIRYRTKEGVSIRRGGTRVGQDAVLLTYRTMAERMGSPLLGSQYEQGINAAVAQETFGDGYQNAPVLKMKHTSNSAVHLTYGAVVGAPLGPSQKGRLEGDSGTLLDLSKTAALRYYLVTNMLAASGKPVDDAQAAKLDAFLSKSIFLVSSGAEDDEADESVKMFNDGSDGWQVFSAKGVASKGDTEFSFAGILTGTVRILDANQRPRLTGYVIAGPAAVQEAMAEYAEKRGNKR